VTRVDFAFGARDRLVQAAQTAVRQVSKGARVFVYSSDAARLKAFGQLLWTHEDTSFVPHEVLSSSLDDHVPVYVVNEATWPLLQPAIRDTDWLINLNDDCPPDLQSLTRVLEIVSQDTVDIEQARARWRHYQTLGAQLHAHKLS